jgi:hypothetical protein
MLSNPFLLFFYLPPPHSKGKKVCCLVLFFFLGTTAPHYRSSFFFSIDTNMATLSVRQDFPSQWRRPKTIQKKACTQKMMYIERKKTDTHTHNRFGLVLYVQFENESSQRLLQCVVEWWSQSSNQMANSFSLSLSLSICTPSVSTRLFNRRKKTHFGLRETERNREELLTLYERPRSEVVIQSKWLGDGPDLTAKHNP